MKISTQDKFQIIYSIYKHEYLEYLFESFIVKIGDKKELTLQHQNISSLNAQEFSSRLDQKDFDLIRLIDSMQQESILKRYATPLDKPASFFFKVFNDQKGGGVLQKEIMRYIKDIRGQILSLLTTKKVFEMGHDGEPTWKKMIIMPEKSSVLFHFRKNEDNTHYFPTIKYGEKKVNFQYKQAYILNEDPAWLVVEDKMYSFRNNIDGAKLKPFFKKKFVLIPKRLEDNYYKNFVAPLVAQFDVYAKGFDIITKKIKPKATLFFYPLVQEQYRLPPTMNEEVNVSHNGVQKFIFKLIFDYEDIKIDYYTKSKVEVTVLNKNGYYTFIRNSRDLKFESEVIKELKKMSLDLVKGTQVFIGTEAVDWIHKNREKLLSKNIELIQDTIGNKTYFIGKASIKVEISENIDWFDINAVILFGEYKISFQEIRRLVIKGKNEFTLPNGEIAIIPSSWLGDYSDLFFYSEKNIFEKPVLKKHHLTLIDELKGARNSSIILSKELLQFKKIERIKEFPLPKNFKGVLRPYQKAGYNWMRLLSQNKLGGCLADDMGLGKTVQTLALLQSQKESGAEEASLLVMPTSLVYNWQKEAKVFTPKLKIFNYTGTQRVKDIRQFSGYDLVLTSYGIIRKDLNLLKQYTFNYAILDESQVLKNPSSNISKSVKELVSRYKLILTGTPIENTTMDLWSQMNFINPGLLGEQAFFKKQFQIPIEKQNSEEKLKKLQLLIKPFIMRRHKSQVAKDLPEKIENIHYSSMSAQQEELYEETKNKYRNEILTHINVHGIGKSQIILLQGLSKLRLIASHPRMADPEYTGNSGKLDDMVYMLENTILEGHKILIFSQFVKHLAIVKDVVEAKKIKYCYLDGSTKNRKKQVDSFQEDEEVKVFLISLKAGGLGLNLTEADYIFLLDPWWNPAVEAQAVDRAHRIGQKKKVFTYKFITKNTVEEKIIKLQKRKLKLASDLISIDQSFVKNLDRKEITDLLE